MILSSIMRRSGQNLGASSVSVWLANALGGARTAAGPPVNEYSALALPTVYACIRVLAESVAQLPLALYRRDGRSRVPAVDHPLYPIVHARPNPVHTSFVWRELLMAHLTSWGNSFHLIERKRRGVVAELWPLKPAQMTVDYVGSQRVYKYRMDDGLLATLPQEKVLHIPGLSFDGLLGWSPIRVHREAIGWGLATQEFSSRFFGNNAMPQGLLKAPGKIQDPDEVKRSWLARNADEGKLGIAVLQQGMEYQQLSISPDDAQFIQTRALQIADICRIFKVPPTMVQDYGRATWSNAEQADLAYVKHTVVPWLTRIEESLNAFLLTEEEQRTLFFKFKVQGLLRGDNTGRSQFYSQGVTNGWLTRNEVRELEDLDPLEGLDEPLTPVAAAQKDPAQDPKKADPAKKDPIDGGEGGDGDGSSRAIALAAAERVLARELGELRRLGQVHADYEAWLAAVNEFYAVHRGWLAKTLAISPERAGRFLDTRWRDLADPKTVKSAMHSWDQGGPRGLLEAVRHA